MNGRVSLPLNAQTFKHSNTQTASETGTPTASFTYDNNGNIITEGTRTFTYDLLNRLTAVTDNQTQAASYVYNARNLRVKKTTPAETRIFHYDVNGRLIAETNATGTTLVEYIYLNDMPLAMVQPTDTVYYYHTDHIDTPRVMTNSAGSVVWKASYNAFGHADIDVSSTITNNLRFPGQYHDAETGLHYNWNRYYNPRTGRYLTPDPIGLEGGIDPFVYVENQPVNYFDSQGLFVQVLTSPFVFVPVAVGIWYYTNPAAQKAIKKLINKILNKNSGEEGKDKCQPKPPSDPSQSPGEDWEWRGSGPPGSDKGAWYRPGTGESLHPDLNHPQPKGPHWDYVDPNGNKITIPIK